MANNENTFLLMQVGSFFEVYGYLNKDDGTYYGSGIQTFAQIDFFGRKQITIKSPLYLTLYESNDMIEDAHGKKET